MFQQQYGSKRLKQGLNQFWFTLELIAASFYTHIRYLKKYMKFGHIFELRDKDLNIALLFSCILSLSCILCFSVAIDLYHKLESYSPTPEKIIRIIFKKPFVAHTDLACERQTFPIQKFANTEIICNLLFSSWKVYVFL